MNEIERRWLIGSKISDIEIRPDRNEVIIFSEKDFVSASTTLEVCMDSIIITVRELGTFENNDDAPTSGCTEGAIKGIRPGEEMYT